MNIKCKRWTNIKICFNIYYMKKKLAIIILILIFSISVCGCQKAKNKTLRIGISSFGSNHNPYYFTMDEEKAIIDLVVDKLFSYEGDNSIATLTKRTNEYIISVNDNIVSADGVVEITYKDVLFDLYYLLDPSYTGTCLLNTLPIVGLESYQNSVIEANKLSSDKMQTALDKCSIEGIEIKSSNVVIKTERELTEEELDILNIYVEPLEYYGNSLQFNVKDNRYGFDKGNIKKLNILKGIGKYQIKSSSYNKISLTKNNVYYGGLPKTTNVELILLRDKVYNEDGYRVSGGDAFYIIYKNEIDCSVISLNESVYEENKRYNFNQKVNGNVLGIFELDEDKTVGLLYSPKRIKILKMDEYYYENFDIIDVIEMLKVR